MRRKDAKDCTGCPKPLCKAKGWEQIDNEAPYGDTSVVEMMSGWCEDHGPWEMIFTGHEAVVEFEFEKIDWSAYTGLTQRQLEELVIC